jgi:hypothetical protein
MTTINVTNLEFETVAAAAHAARARRDYDGAVVLDKLARKINAALSNGRRRSLFGTKLKWTDVPSVFENN